LNSPTLSKELLSVFVVSVIINRINITVFWDSTLCKMAKIYQYSEGTCSLIHRVENHGNKPRQCHHEKADPKQSWKRLGRSV
jgi:hypothetical protein